MDLGALPALFQAWLWLQPPLAALLSRSMVSPAGGALLLAQP
jgi:hypothetical protein